MMYNRHCAIYFPATSTTVGGANKFEGGSITYPLRVEASVKMVAESPPNDAEVKIYNLSRETVENIMAENDEIEIMAGYEPQGSDVYIRQVFKGKIRSTETNRDGVNLVTTIRAGDGDDAISQARVNQRVAPGDVSNGLVTAALESMMGKGVEQGIIVCPKVDAMRAVTLNGDSARKVLDDVAWTTDSVWYITDGLLNLHPRDVILSPTAYELTPENGLIGSPVVADDGIEIEALVVGDLRPGFQIKVRSRSDGNPRINGYYMIQEIDWALTNGPSGDHKGTMKLKTVDGGLVQRRKKRMGGGVT